MSETTLSAEHQEALDYIVGMADIGLAAMQPAVRKQNVKIVQAAVNVLVAALTPKAEPVAPVISEKEATRRANESAREATRRANESAREDREGK